MARHDEILYGSIEHHDGYVFTTAGDSFSAAFATATAAVDAATVAQAVLIDERWPEGISIGVRMGLHTGVADERDGDYFGAEVNRAARLMSVGHGGQVLLSGVTAGLVRTERDDLVDLGEHRLKDLSLAERVWQVPVPGQRVRFPALRSVDAIRGNLPVPAGSFVGRRGELDELEALLAECRLLTLVGVGGSGKTRLALELAASVSDRFDGGVWVVDLWEIDDPDRVEDSIISTLGLQYGQGRNGREILIDALGFAPVLVVLDTCEHLIDAVSALAELLIAACSTLTLIATSREVLSAPSAVSRSVGSLGDDAVELFEARASATRDGFELTSSNRHVVERICDQVDGIPLAIELVAARVATLDPQLIETRLNDVFRVVRSSNKGRPERHRTLKATIEWSYGLLDEAERALFDRLSIFLGGFTLEAIESACTDADQIDELDVVDLLEHLVDKSMVTTLDDAVIGRRYRLLDTTRAFALGRLEERNEVDAWRGRHAQYYVSWVAEASRAAWGPDAARVRRQVVAEIPNLRLATEWYVAQGDFDRAAQMAGIGDLLVAANRFDTTEWLTAVVRMAAAEDHPGFVRAARSVVGLMFGAGRLEEAEALAGRALKMADDPGLHAMMMPMLWTRASLSEPPDDSLRDRALDHARQGVAAADSPVIRIMTYPPLLFGLVERGSVDEFQQHWSRYQDLVEAQDLDAVKVMAANGAGALAIVDPERARPILEDAYPMSVELGMPYMTSRLRSYLAAVETRSGDHGKAARRLLEAIEEDAAIGSWFTAWGWMHRLVLVIAALGFREEAVVLHHAIPPRRALIWVGDSPAELLEQIRRELGQSRYDDLAAQGSRLDGGELLRWLRGIVDSSA
jgi:predicted ATPase